MNQCLLCFNLKKSKIKASEKQNTSVNTVNVVNDFTTLKQSDTCEILPGWKLLCNICQ